LSKQLKLEGRPAQLSGHHRGKRKTDEEWVARFREAHGDCYEYPMPFEYKLEEQNRQKQVKMICPAHGVFYQRAFAHAAGSVCPRCRSQGYKF
jgi:flavorubredoxin